MLSSFEERVLAEFAALNARFNSFEARLIAFDGRLTSVEDKVDARLRETRPIWEGVQQCLTGIEKGLATLNRQFGTLIKDSFDLRSRVERLEDGQAAREG
ncbi:MAG: hypothetical protein LC785_16690 [Acidobacteria bacterium]|nr:hypothetical protein [Acidobacteriota bacterium]MCA1643539.1 hypothetical protein [Acidobacteriota bacterium]